MFDEQNPVQLDASNGTASTSKAFTANVSVQMPHVSAQYILLIYAKVQHVLLTM